jgi:glycosyltransferase involved in cell wall biosynthesis
MTALAPRVSVVLITFNFERFVEESLDSILGQDYPADRLRVIAVDNGSTDRTVELLRGYGDRIELHALRARPLNDAMSYGFERADGDYVTVFSGDDVWTPGRLAHMVELLERRPEVGLVFGDMELIDGDSAAMHPSYTALNRLEHPAGHYLGPLLAGNRIFGPAHLIRGSLKRAFHPIPEHAAWEDWWIATCIARVASIAYTPFTVSRYRRHGNNLTALDTTEKQIKFRREDMRFRGWLLRTAVPGDVDPVDLARAVTTHRQELGVLANLVGEVSHAALGIDAEARAAAALAHERAAVAEDPVTALFAYANAVGHDPLSQQHVEAFVATAAQVESDPPSAGPVDPATVVADAREHVTVALAGELVRDPALLRAYAARVGPDDAATLAIYAPGWTEERAYAELRAALEAAGVAPEAAPDMVALPLPDRLGIRVALTLRAGEMLTGDDAGWPFAALPRFQSATSAG